MEQAQQEHLGGQPEVRLWAGVCGHPAPAEAPSPGRTPFQHMSPCSPSELCGSWPRLKLAAQKGRKGFGQVNSFLPQTAGSQLLWGPAPGTGG